MNPTNPGPIGSAAAARAQEHSTGAGDLGYLAQAQASVLAELGRTDAKAGALLAALALPLAVLAAALPGHTWPPAATVLMTLGGVGYAAALLLVLATVRPRLPHSARASFRSWADLTPEQLPAALASPAEQAATIVMLSRLTRAKYRALRAAIDIAAAATVLLAAALFTA
ncbi:Pycsar system effector family protein [Streptomyces sp. 2.9]|uniref:Pycsar system effector family protein n=1 Tax=Streptomyces tritrimontium TaxID=3406573 RepID=UPI003BB6FF51